MLKNVKCKKGSSLVLIIMVTAVLVILSTALFGLVLSDTKNSVYQNDKVQAHYIGRSGIDVGMKILKNNFLTYYASIDSLIAAANSDATTLGTVPLRDTTGNSIGNFTLKYEKFSSDEIKITSKSSIPKTFNVKDTVTYIVKIANGVDFEENPSEWFTGVNFQKGYGPNNDHLKKAVKLGGQKIQSPKNGSASTFRSEIIYFSSDGDGISFRQIPNSVDVTFDALVIHAEGEFVLNKTPNPVYFKVSQDVLTNWRNIDSDFVDSTLNPAPGFESYDMYKKFAGDVVEVDGKTLEEFYKASYSFDLTSKYGIVYFGGNIVRKDGGSEDLNVFTPEYSHYYFFKNGINLQSINIANKDLVLIKNNDPILDTLKFQFVFKTDLTGSIWNNK